MPSFEFENSEGRRFSVEADTKYEAVQKLSQVLTPVQQNSGGEGVVGNNLTTKVGQSLSEGLSNPFRGYGHTLDALTGNKVENPQGPETASESFRKTWSPSYLPRAVLEQAPGLGLDMAAGGAGAALGSLGGPFGSALGFILGAGGNYVARTFGDTAKEAAVARTGDPNAPITGVDRARAGAASIVSGAIGAVPLGRFASPIAQMTIRDVGARGVAKSVGNLMARSAEYGAVGAGTDLAHQAIVKTGTDQPISLSDAAASGLMGAAAGPALGGLKTARDVHRAVSYRNLTPELEQPLNQVANALRAKGDEIGSLRNTKNAAEALDAVRSDVRNEIKDIYSQNSHLRQTIKADPDVSAAYTRAKKGDATAADVQTIDAAVSGQHNAEPLTNALQRLRAVDFVRGRTYRTGNHATGGISGYLENLGMRAFNKPSAVLGGALLGATPLNPIAYSPSTLGAIGGLYAGGRMLDHLLGTRSPVNSIVQRFAGGNGIRTPSMPPPSTGFRPTGAPGGPGGFGPTGSPTGPKMPPIQPWATRQPPPAYQPGTGMVPVPPTVPPMAPQGLPPPQRMLPPPNQQPMPPIGLPAPQTMSRAIEMPDRSIPQQLLPPPTEKPMELLQPRVPPAPSGTLRLPPPQRLLPPPVSEAPQASTAPSVPPGAAVSKYNGNTIIRMPSAQLPATPTATIQKITKTPPTSKIEARPQPLKPSDLNRASDGLDIPDFLRRDKQNRLPSQAPSEQQASGSLSIDEIVSKRLADKSAQGYFTQPHPIARVNDILSKMPIEERKTRYAQKTRAKLEKRQEIAEKVSKALGLPVSEVLQQAFDARSYEEFRAPLLSKFKYDPVIRRKIDSASKGRSKAW